MKISGGNKPFKKLVTHAQKANRTIAPRVAGRLVRLQDGQNTGASPYLGNFHTCHAVAQEFTQPFNGRIGQMQKKFGMNTVRAWGLARLEGINRGAHLCHAERAAKIRIGTRCVPQIFEIAINSSGELPVRTNKFTVLNYASCNVIRQNGVVSRQ
jgi:F0F1-type ATP synthase beta subunit